VDARGSTIVCGQEVLLVEVAMVHDDAETVPMAEESRATDVARQRDHMTVDLLLLPQDGTRLY
jgi:hypothetical protein